MATVGILIVKLQADISDFAKSMDTAIGKLQKSMSAALPASKMLLGGVTALAGALGAAGIAGVKMAGDMEQTKIAFTTMLGSAEEADKFIRGLWDFAAKTPFEFEGLAQSSRQLLAFGFQAQEIVPMMTAIGDAVSALGGGAFEIDRVTRALGQMRAKGKVSAEEMMQLAELGIPVWQMLADAIGTSIPDAMDKASKGGIDAATGINAILAGMTKQFSGSMEKQSQTLLGLWSTAKDNVSGILRTLGQEIIDTFDLKDKLAGAITALQEFSNTLTRFFDLVSQKGLRQAIQEMIPEDMQAKIVLVAGAIAGALVPAVYSLAAGVWAAMAPLAPFMAAGAAIAGLAYLIYKSWGPIKSFFPNLWESIKTAATNAADALKAKWDAVVGAVTELWDKFKTTAASVWGEVKNTVIVLASTIGGLLLPKLIAMGTQATIAGARVAASWVSMEARAIASATMQAVTAIPQLIVGFVKMGTSATVNAAKVVAAWATTAAGAIANVAVSIAQIAVMGAKWVWLGVQAMANAARVAAAWVIALGPIAWVTAAISGVAALVITHWNEVKNVTSETWTAVVSFIRNAWNTIKEFSTTVWNGIKGTLTEIWNTIIRTVTERWQAIQNVTTTIWTAISGWLSGLWARIQGQVSAAWNAIYGVISGVWTRIRDGFSNLVSAATNWGKNLMNNFIDGFKSMFSRLWDSLKEAADAVAGFLGFHSPTKLGPGRYADEWAPNFVKMYAEGIKNTLPQIQASLKDFALSLSPSGFVAPVPPAPITPTFPGATTTTNYGGITINVYGSGNSQEVVDRLLRELARRGVRF